MKAASASDDKLREECGVFGIFDTVDAAAHTALGLHALQHRGQEGAGIISFDGLSFRTHRALGLVGDIFSDSAVISKLTGRSAIGHVRYSTSGEAILRNVQPFFAEFEFDGLAIAHNGNLTNAFSLRRELVSRGCIFQSTSDTETIIHLIAMMHQAPVIDRISKALRQVEGAFSLLFLTSEALIGVRDPLGVRPLLLGRLGDAYVLASESCAFDIIGAQYVRDIDPGEMVVITKRHGLQSLRPFTPSPSRFCIFEYVYFARPDSQLQNRSVYSVRRQIGVELAKEHPVTADVVVPVPDSGVPGAVGYAAATGIPFELGIIRNHYIGRTFIEPTDTIRHLGVKLKHNANRGQLEGKRVVLVDDSIVRGTTSKKIVEMIRASGVREVHLRIASPPTMNPCFYGVDTPNKDQLLATKYTVERMAELIGVDSLAFISIDGLYRALGEAKRHNNLPQFCDACFTGDYPTRLRDSSEGLSQAKGVKGSPAPNLQIDLFSD